MLSMSSSDTSKPKESCFCCCCISHKFSQAAFENPNKIAIVHSSGEFRALALSDLPNSAPSSSSSSPPLYRGDRCFTYSQLLSAVDSLASRVGSLRIRTQTPVVFGIYIPPSADYVAAVLAVIRSGEAFLPLDPSWPKARVLSIIASSHVDLVIASKSPFGAESSTNWIAESGHFRVLWFSLEEEAEEEKEGNGESRALDWPCEGGEQRSFCYVMYTSGSTGKPKGVCGTEKGLLNRFLWMQELYPLSGEEILLFKTSISFIDHLQEFLSAVLTACTLVVPHFNKLKQNLFSIVHFIQAYSIDRLTAVPSLMRAILPTLESRHDRGVLSSLKLLVLSGETLSLSLWDLLSKILPGTSILNLYGSTEVSGDCTYFDCKRLPMILKNETLISVPIGVPVANCDVVLVDDNELANYGEIYVSGLCNSAGYYDTTFMSLDQVMLPRYHANRGSASGCGDKLYFRTGDFAKRLQGGDLVFLGRKDRTIKLNGQRIALEEIEDALRGHPYVIDAAVISHKARGGIELLGAFLILEKEERSNEILRSQFKCWMLDKLPLAMVPNFFIYSEAFPMTSSGKVDFESLTSEFLTKHVQNEIGDTKNVKLLQVLKKAFRDVLMVEEVSDDDDFFMVGGNSIAAAHLSNNLGIDMRLLYSFPSPSKLCATLLERKTSLDLDLRNDVDWEMKLKEGSGNLSLASFSPNIESGLKLHRTLRGKNENHAVISKRLKLDSKVNNTSEGFTLVDRYPWSAASMCFSCSFSRCNKFIHEGDDRMNSVHQENCAEVPRNRKVSMQDLWKVHTGSCVDASPLIVFKGSDIHLYIGSHSHEFLCVNARSGYVQWKIQLEGRIECSAAILGSFSQVVVGCYQGKLYFIDSLNGNICWTFQTSGEVKSQPVVDTRNQLIWCGSHDHNLYALDYMNHCCVNEVPCGGSIFGSPVIDEVNNALYVASTSGRITAMSIKALPFNILWQLELKVPVFGSLAISSLTGDIICCLVDGHVLALHPSGSINWKHKIPGPIFAGACICSSFPSQVLICSRDGSVYSFEPEKGNLLWEYSVGNPITTSAYVDEQLCLTYGSSLPSERLVCVCSSSGSIILLKVNMDATRDADVEEFARLNLQGDVFSSPVMIGGRIFVGCRDDYVHCVAVDI